MRGTNLMILLPDLHTDSFDLGKFKRSKTFLKYIV